MMRPLTVFVLVTGLFAAALQSTARAQDQWIWARDYTSKALAGGKAREALKQLEAWADEAEKANDPLKAATYLGQAAVAARATNQLEKSLSLATRSFAAGEKARDPVQQARAVSYVIAALESLGQHSQQRQWLEKGFAASKQISHQLTREANEASMYLDLGRLALRDNQFQEAIENISHAVRLRESIVDAYTRSGAGQVIRGAQNNWLATLLALGRAYGRAGNSDQALSAFQKVIELSKRFGLDDYSPLPLTAHFNLGNAYLNRRDFANAETNLRIALGGAQKARLPAVEANASRSVGNLLVATDRAGEAIPHLKKAIDNVESTRSLLSSAEFRGGFFEDKEEIYRDMIFAQIRTKNFADAFNYSERARSRAFLDILGSRAELASGKILEEEQRLRGLVGELESRLSATEPSGREPLRRELDEALKSYNEFLARVRKENKEQASLMTVEPLTLKEVQALLEAGVTLLKYFVSPGGIRLWIVERDRLEYIGFEYRRADLIKQVHDLREAISDPAEFENFKQRAETLHKLLIAPALPHIKGKALVIVPHGVLHYLPFQALLSPQGKYLIEDFPINYLSSASLMQFTREKKRAGRETTLALGNPERGDPAYNLRFAEREAKEIAQSFPKSAVLLKNEATKSKTLELSPNNDIVHFAVHAEFNEEDPLRSALLLAKEGQDDGKLTESEIFSLHLKADMVVLSACDSGLGKISSGDEIVGMTRAFIYAGTPSVITTLWKVDDRASYELMAEFYRNLKSMNKSQALRQAQLKTMKDFPQPLFWAAYGLTGEP
jgi:CHAT domain-containing protein/Flp pilus assembly protein TadD